VSNTDCRDCELFERDMLRLENDFIQIDVQNKALQARLDAVDDLTPHMPVAGECPPEIYYLHSDLAVALGERKAALKQEQHNEPKTDS